MTDVSNAETVPRIFEDAGRRNNSLAIAPAIETFICRCGKPNCAFSCLQPFREHIARLYRAIVACAYSGESPLSEEWQTVLYPLQMAACLEDIEADTAFVDDTQSVMYCRPAAEYESARTDSVRQYVAGLTVFTFLWMAYEAAVSLTHPEHLPGLIDRANGERGRRLFEDFTDDLPSLRSLSNLARLANFLCKKGGLLEERLARVGDKYRDHDLIFSAELCREFRNFIVHGEDEVPEPSEWNGNPEAGTARVRRFYAIGRLLLLLIQALTFTQLKNVSDDIEWGYDEDNEQSMGSAKLILARLHVLDDPVEDVE